MSLPPIIPIEIPALSATQTRMAERTARELKSRYPEITLEPIFAHLAVDHIDDRPSLHCDDLTEIMRPPSKGSITFYQERARLRAVAGDFVATSFPPNDKYERYCTQQLGLGPVHWITPKPHGDPHRLAEACWQDRSVRRKLVHAIRSGELRYIHPHYGTKAVWQLALLLQQASHMHLGVIGAPPGLSAFVNDKGRFAELVRQLFGKAALPPTKMVWNKALAADELCELCHGRSQNVSVKLPSSAGGEGNLVFSGAAFCNKTMTELRTLLEAELPKLGYEVGDELVVSIWEDDVLAAPSVQYWIPPQGAGQASFEGIYKQFITGSEGNFAGSAPTQLPDTLRDSALEQTQVLARIFQELGYVGRCSFDLLLVGPTLANASLHFIECNGRWGGTSLPMTFLNQIFGSWHDHPYAVLTSQFEGDDPSLSFSEVFNALKNDLLDLRTVQDRGAMQAIQRMKGKQILIHPRRIEEKREITTILLTESWEAAENTVATDLKSRLSTPLSEPQT